MKYELYHYGVLGMKWGAHKARTYAADKNRYVRKQRDKIAESKYKIGEYNTNQYRSALRRNKRNEYRKNQKVIGETLKLSPKKGEKVSSIYNKYRKQAIKTIPNYKLKRGAKIAGKVLYTIGRAAFDINPAFSAGRIGLKTAVNFGVKSLATGAATGFTKEVAKTVGQRVAEDTIYKHKNKKGGNK